jgi:hypothetical protein
MYSGQQEGTTMSRAAILNHWDSSKRSQRAASDPTVGMVPVLAWFGICISAAVIGTYVTSDAPVDRARLVIAQSSQ